MRISETCIRRPVFATLLSLVIVLIGMISYSRLTVREYPRIEELIVSVDTTYRDASPEVIESQVTKPLEDQLAGIEGIVVMTSHRRSERSQINIEFTLDRDSDAAAADVRDKVSRAWRFLPNEVDEPIISKVEADTQAVINIAVESGNFSVVQTSDYIQRYIKTRLSVLPWAAEVRVFGERLPSMRLYVDRDKLAALGLTVQDVETALAPQNVDIPAGQIGSGRVSASSRWCLRPICRRWRNLKTSYSRRWGAIPCGCAMWPPSRLRPTPNGCCRASITSLSSTSA